MLDRLEQEGIDVDDNQIRWYIYFKLDYSSEIDIVKFSKYHKDIKIIDLWG